MDLLTRTEIEELASPAEGTHVSVFLPTHRAGQGTEGDPIRYKNLLSAVEQELLDQGVRRPDVAELLAPAWELHGDAAAWQHMSDGLAVLIRPGLTRVYRLPLPLPELVTVGDRFVVTPLLPMLGDEHFLVLALSRGDVRLLDGARARVEQLELTDVPTSLAEVVGRPDERTDSLARPLSGGRGGPAVFYGTGGLDGDERREEVTTFLREVSRGLDDVLGTRTLPMVLAGLPETLAVYRSVNGYPHVLDDAVETNPDGLRDEELHAAAWPIIERRLAAAAEEDAADLARRLGTGTATSDAGEVLRAAQEGRVEALLLAPGCFGDDPSGTTVVRLDADPSASPCEAADAAAVATLSSGGRVRVVDELPQAAQVSALLRY